jgi:hypothetical protein
MLKWNLYHNYYLGVYDDVSTMGVYIFFLIFSNINNINSNIKINKIKTYSLVADVI